MSNGRTIEIVLDKVEASSILLTINSYTIGTFALITGPAVPESKVHLSYFGEKGST